VADQDPEPSVTVVRFLCRNPERRYAVAYIDQAGSELYDWVTAACHSSSHADIAAVGVPNYTCGAVLEGVAGAYSRAICAFVACADPGVLIQHCPETERGPVKGCCFVR
jgi:hypothetical protein